MQCKNYRQSYKDNNHIKLYKDYEVLVLLIAFVPLSASLGYGYEGYEAQTQLKHKTKKTYKYTGNSDVLNFILV